MGAALSNALLLFASTAFAADSFSAV